MSASTPGARASCPPYLAAAMPLRPAPDRNRSKRSEEAISPVRRGEWLRDLLERRQRLATLGMRRQCRPTAGIEHARMRFTGKADDAGHRDVGVADDVAEPEGGFAHRAI